jgi:hypothetical protein
MAIINKTNNGKDAGGKEQLVTHRWWQSKLVQPLWKSVWKFINKLKVDLTYDLSHFRAYIQRSVDRDICIHVIAVSCTIAKLWKQPRSTKLMSG